MGLRKILHMFFPAYFAYISTQETHAKFEELGLAQPSTFKRELISDGTREETDDELRNRILKDTRKETIQNER